MTKVKYSKDVDALLIEFSDKKIDYADDKGQFIIHYSPEGDAVLLEILDAKEFILSSLSSVVNDKEVVVDN
jgi:uncharacterized protein YuzE